MAKGIPDKTYEGGLHGFVASVSGNMVLAAFAELIGTFLLVLVGTAVATAASLGKNAAGPAYDALAIGLSFGLILIPIVASIGQISGAHVNSAVTIALSAGVLLGGPVSGGAGNPARTLGPMIVAGTSAKRGRSSG